MAERERTTGRSVRHVHLILTGAGLRPACVACGRPVMPETTPAGRPAVCSATCALDYASAIPRPWQRAAS